MDKKRIFDLEFKYNYPSKYRQTVKKWYKSVLYWRDILKRYVNNFSEEFIREYADYIDWEQVSMHVTLSEDFIREFQDKVKWGPICHNQKLSEDFIREFKDKVNWSQIAHHQTLSEDFIREFQDELYFYWEKNYFKKEFADKWVRTYR